MNGASLDAYRSTATVVTQHRIDGATATIQGPPGAGRTALVVPLVATASAAVPHTFPYAPRVTLLLPSGEEVEADVVHLPGQVVLTFAAPFTGTLSLA